MAEEIQIHRPTSEGNTFLATARVVRDLLNLLSAGKASEAAEMYSLCQEDIGYLLINKTKQDGRLHKQLANMFFKARDFEKAALSCENLKEYGKAAQLYEQADDYQSAAELFTKEGNIEKAAEMFERNQNFRQAAELFVKAKNFSRAAANYEKAVDYFIAGKLYHELGKFRKSVELLQKVRADEDNFQEATLLIGNILAKNGYLDLAIKKILNVIKDRTVDAETADLHYHLAALYAQKGNVETARNIYQQLLVFDISFRDVEEKLKDLEQSVTAMAAGGGENQSEPEALDLSADVPEGHEGPSQIIGVMDGFNFLQKIPLFADMPLPEMKAFYNICEERTFQNGERLIEQGQPGIALFVVRSGTVSVQRVDGERVTEVTTLGPGSHVGEMSLIDEQPTSARVAAKGAVVAFEIVRDRFLRFIATNDKFAARVYKVFVRTMAQRLRETTSKLSRAT
jgi:tetratricopeptide (TPR) repeat protein